MVHANLERNFPFRRFCLPFAQTVDQPVSPCILTGKLPVCIFIDNGVISKYGQSTEKRQIYLESSSLQIEALACRFHTCNKYQISLNLAGKKLAKLCIGAVLISFDPCAS